MMNQNKLKKKRLRQRKPDERQKPLWVILNKNDFDSLIQDIYNNLNSDEFKTTVDKKAYNLKNSKKFFMKITIQKNNEKEALKLYSDLIDPEINALEKFKSKGKDRRNNILNVLKSLKSVFTGIYLSYSNKPQNQKNVSQKEQN